MTAPKENESKENDMTNDEPTNDTGAMVFLVMGDPQLSGYEDWFEAAFASLDGAKAFVEERVGRGVEWQQLNRADEYLMVGDDRPWLIFETRLR